MKKYVKLLTDNLTKPVSKKYYSENKYLSRELSWIEFNKRVLFQTVRKQVPLIERCSFLDITSSNMDEFIMVRLSSVMNKLKYGVKEPELSGMYPQDEYHAILKAIKSFKELQDNCYEYLINTLESRDVKLVKYKSLNDFEKRYIDNIFYQNIFPLLTPVNIDSTNQFPVIKSKQLNIIVSLEDSIKTNLQVISFIPLDSNLDLIYKLPSKSKESKYILLEEVIYANLNKIYANKRIIDYGLVKILREADIEVSHDESTYIVDRMRQTLQKRKFSDPIFMDITSNVSKSLQKLLMKIFEIDKSHVYEFDNSFNYKALHEIYLEGETYQRFTSQYPSELIGELDMFSAIDNGDILLHSPYESYDPVIKLLEHAANDKSVVSIRQTLYRVSSIDSPIVNALCNAASKGKQVTVILEIKARFDEERNISLIEKLKNCGVQLVYGTELYKTHCKFICIVRKAQNKRGFKIYSHIGTGNYNDKTANIYTDISYFTSKFKIGIDLLQVFNMLTGFSEPTDKINKVYFSPFNLRSQLIKNIDNEIKLAKNDKPAIITIKVNSLSDKIIIDKLYEASKAGVKIMVFCRGICSMKPINKNITIRSIVGRFLEHSRIYYFHNNKQPNVYISSADLLTRNLDKRFELLLPIEDIDCRNKLLKILSMYYKDTFNSFQMDKHGNYVKLAGDCNIHELFMEEAIENYKLKSIPKLTKQMK